MHRFRSKSTILRFRFAALLVCLKFLLVPTAVGILMYGLLLGDDKLAVIALALGIVTILSVILQWILATRTRCPLCLTPVLADKECSKHRHARTALGSHRLRVALAILFKDSFECPYCHEKSAMEIRPGRR